MQFAGRDHLHMASDRPKYLNIRGGDHPVWLQLSSIRYKEVKDEESIGLRRWRFLLARTW
jgi:hypothetical protein